MTMMEAKMYISINEKCRKWEAKGKNAWDIKKKISSVNSVNLIVEFNI